jgi:hypothetical protein
MVPSKELEDKSSISKFLSPANLDGKFPTKDPCNFRVLSSDNEKNSIGSTPCTPDTSKLESFRNFDIDGDINPCWDSRSLCKKLNTKT